MLHVQCSPVQPCRQHWAASVRGRLTSPGRLSGSWRAQQQRQMKACCSDRSRSWWMAQSRRLPLPARCCPGSPAGLHLRAALRAAYAAAAQL